MKPKPLDFNKILKIIERKDIGDYTKAHEIEEVIKRRLKSACDFYLRYKNKPELLVKEHPEIVKKKIQEEKKFFKFYSEENFIIWGYKDNIEYNEWLFKLAFKGVLGGDEND